MTAKFLIIKKRSNIQKSQKVQKKYFFFSPKLEITNELKCQR